MNTAAAAPAATGSGGSELFDADFAARLEQLQLLARRRLRGSTRGEHLAQRRGRGLEFFDFRHYQPGDDLRHLDWNIYSRLDRLVLKLFKASEDVSLHLLIDASASMRFGTPAKFDYARRLAAALAWISLHNLDRVGISSFAATLGPAHHMSNSARHMTGVLRFVEQLECGGETQHAAPLRQFALRARPPGIAVVIGDFLAAEDGLRGLDALRTAGHDVVLLQVLDEDEITPPLDGALTLVDGEDGSSLRVNVDAALRASYERRLQRTLQGIERHCQKHRIGYLRVSTAVPFEDVLLRYLRGGSLLA